MCEGRASFMVNRDGVEGACNEYEVLPVGLLTRPRLDRGRSCERVTRTPQHERNRFPSHRLQSPLRRARAWRTVQDGSVLARIGPDTHVLGLKKVASEQRPHICGDQNDLHNEHADQNIP